VTLAALLVLAGCTFGGQPSTTPGDARPSATGATPAGATGSPTATATPGTEVDAIYDASGYDPQLVLERVERIRGLEATGPIEVYTYGLDKDIELGWEEDVPDRFAGVQPSGAAALQLYSSASAPASQPLGYAEQESDGTAVVNLLTTQGHGRLNASQEATLAHEYVHALQYQHGLVDPDWPPLNTTDALLARTMLAEGQASFVAQRYRDRYDTEGFDVDARNHSGARPDWSRELFSVAYYYGYEYAKTADSWEERSDRLREPRARTTATMLHPGLDLRTPGERVPAPQVPGLDATGRDRVGELVVRFSLRTNGVPFTEARAAAAGWRNDSMVYYDADAVYWGTRWANGSEATEFATAWREMLEGLGATTEDDLLVVPGNETRPTTYYAIERSGSLVRMASGQNRTAVERIADAWGEGSAATERVDAP
jgi:hypothetical protein